MQQLNCQIVGYSRVCKVFVTNIIVRRVERSNTHKCQFSDPPGPVGAVR